MDAGYLFAALIWGSVGLGFFIYGKKQKSPVPLVCGMILMGASYFAQSTLTLSVFGIVVVAVIYVLKKMM